MAELKLWNGYPLWLYVPSAVAGIIFTVLFVLGAAAIMWRMYTTRAWYCTAFLVGVLFQVVGYAARAVARNKTDQLMPYVIQSVLILVSPALFAASVYMVLGRIIVSIRGERYSIIRVKRLTLIFVLGDVASFMVQSSGAGMMVNEGMQKMSEYIVIGGLFIQIIIFGLFIVTSVIFHRRINEHEPNTSQVYGDQWRRMLIMLYVVSVLIMVRSVFRLVEYIMGHDGYLLKNEWPLYVFDAALMFAVVAIFAWQFPGEFHVKPGDFEMSSHDEVLPAHAREAGSQMQTESHGKARY